MIVTCAVCAEQYKDPSAGQECERCGSGLNVTACDKCGMVYMDHRVECPAPDCLSDSDQTEEQNK